MITMGGNAEIELIDSMDPFSEGEPCIRRQQHCVYAASQSPLSARAN